MGTNGIPAKRKQAEEALRTLSARQEAILAAVPDILMEVDKNKIYTWANPAGLEFFGKDVVGKEAAFYFEGEQDTYGQGRPLFSGSEDVIYVESWQRRKDGEKRLLAWHCRVLKDKDGNVVGALSSAHDITEPRQAEDALYENEQRLASIYNTVGDVIFQLAVEEEGRYRFTLVNPAFLATTGLTSAQVVGKRVDEVIPEPSLSMVLEKYAVAIREKGIVRWEEISEYPTGRLTGEVSIAPIFDESGHCTHLVGAVHDITEHKRAESALQKERDLAQQYLDVAGVLIAALNADGQITLMNQRGCEILGYEENELIGCDWVEVCLPVDVREEVRGVFERLMADDIDSVEYHENVVLTKSGAQRILAFHNTVIRGQASRITGILFSGEDITERKQAEEKLRYQATLLESVNDAIVASDAQFRLTAWNAAAESLYGWKAEEVIGRNGLEIMRTEWPAADAEEMRRMIAEKRHWRGEATQARKDGSRIPVEVSSLVLRDGNGQITGYVSMNRDITERKHAEEARLESEVRFRVIFEKANDAIHIDNADDEILAVNSRMCELMGYSREELLKMRVADLQAPERRQSGNVIKKELARHGGAIFEGLNLHRDGRRIPVEISIGRIELPSGELYVSIVRDVTERKRMGEKLEEERILLRTLIDNLPDRVYVMDTQGRKIISNISDWQASGGKTMEDVIGKTDIDTYPPELAEDFWAIDKAVIDSGISIINREEPGLDSQGNPVRVLSSKVPLRDGQGKVVGLVGVGRDITERKKAEQEIRQRVTELEVLYENGLSINRLLEPKEIAQKMIGILAQKLAWHHAAVRLYHPETDSIQLLAFNDPGLGRTEIEGQMERLNQAITRPGKGLSGWVIKHGKVVRSSQVQKDRRYVETYPGIQSGLYIPIQIGGRTVGSIAIESEAENAFSAEDERMLTTLAAQSAIAFENARLFAETEKRLHNLSALHIIDTAISASVDIDVTLNILLEQVVSELEVDATAVLLLDPITRTLEYTVSRGFRAHLVDGMRIQLGAGLAGQAALRRQMQSISDLRDIPPSQGRQKPAFDVYEGEGFVTHYAKPLVAKGQVQGVLEVYHRSPFQPDDEWFAFLEMLSGQAAIAIDNANLFDNLQRSNTDILLAYDATIQGWSQALELRDKETEGHAQRVTELTLRLAQVIGIPNTELEHVRRGTLLHDIGKMGIPDSILLKPSKLTGEEWDIMRQHSVYAFELLSSIAYLKPALDIPHYHHERWDGTGYPDGLKGEQIPLYARIFAIVDVYDALTSDRPYRPAWTVEKALEHIREQSGKHFEPRIVEAFLALISREK